VVVQHTRLESRQAEEAGFETALCSDHFHPWNEEVTAGPNRKRCRLTSSSSISSAS